MSRGPWPECVKPFLAAHLFCFGARLARLVLHRCLLLDPTVKPIQGGTAIRSGALGEDVPTEFAQFHQLHIFLVFASEESADEASACCRAFTHSTSVFVCLKEVERAGEESAVACAKAGATSCLTCVSKKVTFSAPWGFRNVPHDIRSLLGDPYIPCRLDGNPVIWQILATVTCGSTESLQALMALQKGYVPVRANINLRQGRRRRKRKKMCSAIFKQRNGWRILLETCFMVGVPSGTICMGPFGMFVRRWRQAGTSN